MATLIPPVNLDDIQVKSERDVAKALVEQLPNDCVVYHSYPWLRLERDNYNPRRQGLQQGEADFLIIWPEKGMLVLEVKGGKIRFDEEQFQWFSTNRRGYTNQIKDPFEQASKNMHAIKSQLAKKSFPGGLPFTYGFAVCFPDLVYKGGVAPGSDPNIILHLQHFLTSTSFKEGIENCLKKWQRGSASPIDKPTKEKIKQAIMPAFKLVAKMSRQIEDQEEQLLRLTEEQFRVLEFCRENTRVHIKGVAGSGKTLLALEQAKYFAEQGQSTLLLCYNKALANWLKTSIPREYAEQIQVFHFHGVLAYLCKQANIPFDPSSHADFWGAHAADLLSQALIGNQHFRFDALIVDEAQDFLPEWWIVLDELNRKGSQGNLFVFYDPRQTLFQPKEAIPDMQFGGNLPTNCRNTCRITKTCSEILGEAIATHPTAPQGEKVEFFVNKTPKMLAQLIESHLKELIQNQGLDLSQIAILAPQRQSRTCLSGFNKLNRIPVNDDIDSWRKDHSLLMTTIRSFKGLEADVVLLVLDSNPKADSVFTEQDYFVAASRAKHVLKIYSPVPLALEKS